MINNVALVGRLTKDIDLRKTTSNVSTCTFALAVERKYKVEGGPTADFINCVAWRQSADFLSQYAQKGSIIGIEGSIQTRTYDGQNGKVFITEVLCDRVKLIGNKSNNTTNNTNQANNQTYTPPVEHHYDEEEDNFSNKPNINITTDELPFY